jgi:hypothetical protein
MYSNEIALLVLKLRFRRLQHPRGLSVGIGPANIDLEPCRMRDQNKLLAGRRPNQIWNVWLFHGSDSSIGALWHPGSLFPSFSHRSAVRHPLEITYHKE